MKHPNLSPLPAIRPMALADSEPVHEFLRRMHLDTYPNPDLGITAAKLADRFAGGTPEQRRERLATRLASDASFAWVAVDEDGSIVGLSIPVKAPDGSQHIAAIYVAPQWQGQGLAGQLMECSLGWLDITKPIELYVVSYNERAKAFYRKWGFTEVPNSDRMLDDLLPEVKMVRQPTG